MVFRLIESRAADLTTIRVAGRLRDDGVVLLGDACGAARRPLVLDLSELTSASDAGALLLRRLAREGVHLLGASPYVKLLLERAAEDRGQPLRSSTPQPRATKRRQARIRHRAGPRQ